MATLKPELKDILNKYGIDPRDKSQLWDCHGTLVLYHKAYEIIAAKESITFDPPTIIEGNSKDKIVALCVTGRMGTRVEWSFGEASPSNLKSTYPYAMAEKRAKDRVIAKLVGLAAYVYSEEEADDFKSGSREEVKEAPQKPLERAPETERQMMTGDRFLELQKDIRAATTLAELQTAWGAVNAAKVITPPTSEQLKTLTKVKDERKAFLELEADPDRVIPEFKPHD